MTAEEIRKAFITVPEIMTECGQDRNTVYNWLKYHRYMDYENVLGRPAVRRDVYEAFKQAHPELVKVADRGEVAVAA